MTKLFRRAQFLHGALYFSVPKAYRSALGLKKGDYVSIELVNNILIVEPAVCPSTDQPQACHTADKGSAAHDGI